MGWGVGAVDESGSRGGGSACSIAGGVATGSGATWATGARMGGGAAIGTGEIAVASVRDGGAPHVPPGAGAAGGGSASGIMNCCVAMEGGARKGSAAGGADENWTVGIGPVGPGGKLGAGPPPTAASMSPGISLGSTRIVAEEAMPARPGELTAPRRGVVGGGAAGGWAAGAAAGASVANIITVRPVGRADGG
jgi:hypothetical protein